MTDVRQLHQRGSLVVVGTGITLGAHVTAETTAEIQSADVVFHLVTEPATEAWLQRLNPSCESLEGLYAEGKSRVQTYFEMTDRIVGAVRAGKRVCAAFYGHPGVYVNAAHSAVVLARDEGFPARMLPAISAEACLYADLGVNPGDCGCQSFEATDFLASRRRFDPTSVLILYQVGVLGESSVRRGMTGRRERLTVLQRALRKHYPPDHPLVLYEASPFPTFPPSITHLTLSQLEDTRVPAMTTLYVPPRPQRAQDASIVLWYLDS
jgi:Tetrapyrrole (Corrin/Porphyrin) Methylases